MSVLKYSVIFLMAWSAFLPSYSAATGMTPQLNSQQNSYAKNLVKEALSQISAAQQVFARPGTDNLSELETSSVDIVWVPEQSIDAKTDHHIVKLPVFRGLLSYYSVIYHKPSILSAARNGFKDSEVGMLHGDNVAQSLKDNGAKVVKTRAVQSLAHMLNKARFDAILAPVNEVTGLSVTQAYETPQQIALIYNPYFFVVHKDKPQLANALEQGLRNMLQNGELNYLLENTPWMQETREHLAKHELLPLKLAGTARLQPQSDLAEGFWVYEQGTRKTSDVSLTASN